MKRGICFILLLYVPCCRFSELYFVPREKAAFEKAQNICNGLLTDMKNMEEAQSIFSVVSDAVQSDGIFHFWIGLKKPKTRCVEKNAPLKGFVWTVDNSTDSKLNEWNQDPPETCTGTLCGLLSVDIRKGTVDNWSFKSMGCKIENRFICKRPHYEMKIKFIRVPDEPQVMEVRCPLGAVILVHPQPDGDLKLDNGSSINDVLLCPECESGHPGSHKESCGDHCDLCSFGCIDYETSSVCNCVKGYVQSEDGTSCKKMSARQDDPSTVSLNLVSSYPPTFNSTPLAPTSGINTMTTAATQLQNTFEGKFSIFIPVLVVLSVLVVLVVLVLAIIKCCLRKNSKKLSGKKELKSKESVDLRTSDSMKQCHEKETP
ncbi:C-type lectin domain family 14 member A [Scleropages formosus]|uniref:C-type lectin domain family 14 member A n=1 Tax=Scleropages formosus TaxID=113540 RepID=UPI000878BDE7|nr:uncharacterized protein LOC108923834 [Scleropages formosus]